MDECVLRDEDGKPLGLKEGNGTYTIDGTGIWEGLFATDTTLYIHEIDEKAFKEWLENRKKGEKTD